MPETLVQADKIQGYLEGLEPVWTSPGNNLNLLGVGPGACYIPGFADIVHFPTTTYAPAGALAASTSYHLYGYADATTGVGRLELSTQAPATPYWGRAKVKGPTATPDNTRRYLGFGRTNLTGTAFWNFTFFPDGWVYYNENLNQVPFRILFDGRAMAASPATVTVASALPSHSKLIDVSYQMWEAEYFGISTVFAGINTGSDWTTSSTIWHHYGYNSDQGTSLKLLLDAAQQFRYQFAGTTMTAGYGCYMQLRGYLEER